MQETKPRTPADDSPAPRPPWIRAVAIVAAVALLGGALYATWQGVAGNDDPEPDPIGLDESEPDFSLTDEQAIETFERLYTTSASAIRNQDQSLLPTVLTDGGPVYERAQDQIAQLKKDGITDASNFEIMDSRVTANDANEVTLEIAFRLHTCFLDGEGNDVTEGPRTLEQDSVWTLQVEDSRWQIHQGVLQEDRVIRNQNEDC
jgi:hypothetical protein